MALSSFVFGGGVPTGWSFARAEENRSNARTISLGTNPYIDKVLVQPPVDGGKWPVRHQCARGTCSAFAVTAAEELYRYYANPNEEMLFFSEEYLYAKSRAVGYSMLSASLNAEDEARLVQTGGTFLEQAMIAMDTHGLAPREDVPYECHRPVAAVLEGISPSVEQAAAAHVVSKDQFDHDVTTDAAIGDERFWAGNTNEVLLSAFFAQKIQAGRPVAASFAILWGAEYVWRGHVARLTGKVKYPPVEAAKDRRPVAGHAVCLVGFKANPDPDGENRGWFLFRNSLGTSEFAYGQPLDTKEPISLAPGYGTISASDVDLYCWEYLARKHVSDGLPIK